MLLLLTLACVSWNEFVLNLQSWIKLEIPGLMYIVPPLNVAWFA